MTASALHKQNIIEFISDYRTEHEGISPTLQEIADAVYSGLSNPSKGNMSRLVSELISEGYLRRVAEGQRTLVLTDKAQEYGYLVEE